MQVVFDESQSDFPLRFDGVLVIVGAGTVDVGLLKTLHKQGAAVIAADSGADACARVGIVPEAIIGDMDSLENQEDWAAKTRILKFEEQETIDFEKCLYATEAPVTIALGMTGKRFDHTLAGLDVLARYADKRRVILVDEEDIVLAVRGTFSFAVTAGAKVSVHPLGSVTFAHSDGLEYPLDGLTLAPGVRGGTSNVAVEGPFSIMPEKDAKTAWLLLIEQKYLDALIGEFV